MTPLNLTRQYSCSRREDMKRDDKILRDEEVKKEEIVLRVCQEAEPKGEKAIDDDRRCLDDRPMSIDRR